MPINIFRFFLDLIAESYVISILLYWLISQYVALLGNRKEGIWNNLNLIGLGLGILVLCDEINSFFGEPASNYARIDWTAPFRHAFWMFSLVAYCLSILVFISKKRRKAPRWIVLGVGLLLLPKIIYPFKEWLVLKQLGHSIPISWHLLAFSSPTWWLSLIFVATFLGAAHYFSAAAPAGKAN